MDGEPLNLLEMTLSPELVNSIPASLAIRHRAIPIAKEGGRLLVAMVDPDDVNAIQELEMTTGFIVEPARVDELDLQEALDNHYARKFFEEDEPVDLNLDHYLPENRRRADGSLVIPVWRGQGDGGAAWDMADWLMDELMKADGGYLEAEFQRGLGATVMLRNPREAQGRSLGDIESEGLFRAMLDFMAKQFIEREIYGGYARQRLRYNGRPYVGDFFLANNLRCGFWFRIYVAPGDG